MYPKDILSDEACASMTDEELGVYMRLLCHAWLEGSIPADEERIARLLRKPKRSLRRVWPAVSRCFVRVDDRLIQRRLEAERLKQAEYRDKQSARAKSPRKPNVINESDEPRLSHGRAAAEPRSSLPSPSPSPITDRSVSHGSAAAGGPTESALRIEVRKLLASEARAGGLPQDVLLAQCSRTPGGKIITDVERCPSSKWLQATRDRLLQRQLAREAEAQEMGRPTTGQERRHRAIGALVTGGLEVERD